MGRVISKQNDTINKNLSIKDFYNIRNNIRIERHLGGGGDILMTRMLFQDIKLLDKNLKVIYALPEKYHSLVSDHPFIDIVTDIKDDNKNYLVKYNISDVCGATEVAEAPNCQKHRSDIWAEYCGYKLTKHEMYLSLYNKQYELPTNDKKTILLCPISAFLSKSLDEKQTNGVISQLKDKYNIVVAHSQEIQGIDAQQIVCKNFLEFLCFINSSDYIISVDTFAFHAAGGLKKPLVGIFTWADSTVYGKYFNNFIAVQKHRKWNKDWQCCPCYTWSNCPLSNNPNKKPCITELTADEIVEGFYRLLEKMDGSSNS